MPQCATKGPWASTVATDTVRSDAKATTATTTSNVRSAARAGVDH
jgi:hypothetical protein